MSEPTAGAVRAATACYNEEVAVLDPGYYPGEAEIEFNILKAAAIIDRETGAKERDTLIADLCKLHGCSTEMVYHWCEWSAKRADAIGAKELADALSRLLNELDGEAFAQVGTAKAEMLFQHAAQARAALAKYAKGAV